MMLIIEQYKAAFAAAAIGCLILLAVAVGWKMNGWRLGSELALAKADIERYKLILGQQNDAITKLGAERASAVAVASAAQSEAMQARAQVKTRIVTVMQSPASSCADVLLDQWGKL